MKERPILMNAFSVQAILAGRKTKTRRVDDRLAHINQNPDDWQFEYILDGLYVFVNDETGEVRHIASRFTKGDHLWVRETWQVQRLQGPVGLEYPNILYRADSSTRLLLDKRVWDYLTDTPHWRPSIFMPRWASRILLEIINVRVERVQDISVADCCAEGIQHSAGYPGSEVALKAMHRRDRQSFVDLWNEINAKRGYGWELNPWAWALTFRRVESEEQR